MRLEITVVGILSILAGVFIVITDFRDSVSMLYAIVFIIYGIGLIWWSTQSKSKENRSKK